MFAFVILLYLIAIGFIGISLWMINYHLQRFGIDEQKDRKIQKIINLSVGILFIINLLLFFFTPWSKILSNIF